MVRTNEDRPSDANPSRRFAAMMPSLNLPENLIRQNRENKAGG